jgi:hypothetical protein
LLHLTHLHWLRAAMGLYSVLQPYQIISNTSVSFW